MLQLGNIFQSIAIMVVSHIRHSFFLLDCYHGSVTHKVFFFFLGQGVNPLAPSNSTPQNQGPYLTPVPPWDPSNYSLADERLLSEPRQALEHHRRLILAGLIDPFWCRILYPFNWVFFVEKLLFWEKYSKTCL